jgi:hypothetical protein
MNNLSLVSIDKEGCYNNSMNEKQTVWVVYEEDYDGYTNIIGVYTEESIAKEVYNRSVNYSIDSVFLNAE